MTAAELASFRALLQAQSAAPPGDRGLFARMRSRLTVVEGSGLLPPAGGDPAREPGVASRPAVSLCSVVDGPVADPPPATPPVFGRREGGCAAASEGATGCATAPASDPASRVLRRRFDEPSTPDELDDVRGETQAASALRAEGPAPGVIAGWSRTRPPSAQRRLLGRLEAVLLAEFQGLEARIAADASPA